MTAHEFDFKRFTKDGVEFEQLIRELARALGYKPEWSGQGPDGGRDLVIEEPGEPDFGGYPRRWLVSCKHKAVSGKAVGYQDLGEDPVGRLRQHRCDGWLLACSTHPSSELIRTIDGWRANSEFAYHYWDSAFLRVLLARPDAASVVKAFFGSAAADALAASDATVLVTWDNASWFETPNPLLTFVDAGGVAFYFETRGREGRDNGSDAFHKRQIELALDHLAQTLPATMPHAVRGVFWDDKNSQYQWLVDVASTDPAVDLNPEVLGSKLSSVLTEPEQDSGQWHGFEVRAIAASDLGKTNREEESEGSTLLHGWPLRDANPR